MLKPDLLVTERTLQAAMCAEPENFYRAEKKSWYVVARNFFLLLLNLSAWSCLVAA